jgi:hypothetical protein
MDASVAITAGMEVVGRDDQRVGRVKQVFPGGILHVDCPLAPDYYIPKNAVQGVQEGKVVLRCSKAQAAYMGWELKPESAKE